MKDMAVIIKIHSMSDRAILREIGQRLKRLRLDKNLSQQKLAEGAGLNRTTIGEIERGAPSSLLTFVQILRGLDALEDLNSFLPDPELKISPLQIAKLQGKERRRASSQREKKQDGEPDW